MITDRRKFIAALAVSAGAAHLRGDETAPRKSPELAFELPKKGQTLLSRYRGRVVALEFILTTCPHCQAAAKTMTKLQDRYGAMGLQALDVAIDQDAGKRVETFAKEHGAGFPVGWASLDQMMAYMGFAARPTVPQLVLIDRTGTIRYQTPTLGDSEAMKEEIVEGRIKDLLKSK